MADIMPNAGIPQLPTLMSPLPLDAPPSEWLPLLTRRLDRRGSRIDGLYDLVEGNAPLPEMGQNTRESWQRFQKEARTNFARICVDALADRVVPTGVRVGGLDDSPQALQARKLFRDCRLATVFSDAMWHSFVASVGYIIVGTDGDNLVVTAESPRYVITAPDPLRPWVARAAMKLWRDNDQLKDFAIVWANNQKQVFSRPTIDTDSQPVRGAASEAWTIFSDPEPYDGDVPVYALYDKADLGEFEPHVDILNRINRNILQRLTTTAMQAFRQRAIQGGLPKKDEAGNDIDWSSTFEPAPGAVWDLPEGIEIWESSDSAQGISAMLQGERADLQTFAAVTQTPMPMLMPDDANQSAQGAMLASSGLIFKAMDRINRFKPVLALVMVKALAAAGVEEIDDVEILFEEPAYVTVAEKYAAAAQAINVLSRKTIQRQVLGMSQTAIDEDSQNLAQQQLQAAILMGSSTNAANSADTNSQ